jgi:hypothetical protein
MLPSHSVGTGTITAVRVEGKCRDEGKRIERAKLNPWQLAEARFLLCRKKAKRAFDGASVVGRLGGDLAIPASVARTSPHNRGPGGKATQPDRC